MALRCRAIVHKSGNPCSREAAVDMLCRIHYNSLQKHGVARTREREITAMYIREFRELSNVEGNEEMRFIAERKYLANMELLRGDIARETAILGHHPDRDVNILKQQRFGERLARKAERRQWRRVIALPPNPNEHIGAFAQDAQNVHTTIAVRQTQENIRKILETCIPDDEHRWNGSVLSKTPGEIMIGCELSPPAALQMVRWYTSESPIYEMENGIYGKTLDAIWVFIQGHEDKACLLNILKVELEDNVDMCAQGNLTRLANVVAGYMEGIVEPKSDGQLLCERFIEISKIENEDVRLHEAEKALRDANVPREEWSYWVDTL